MLKYDHFHKGDGVMNFSNFDKLRMPASYVSSDVLVYRYDGRGQLEVLVGLRQNDPWKNSTTVPMGGYVDDKDVSLLTSSIREVEEETGLKVEAEFFVGIYGPERYHHEFDGEKAVKTGEKGHVRPVVANVFAGLVVGGKLKDTAEQKGLHFVRPSELAGKLMPFDHALVLADFLDALEDESAYTWRKEALKLVR